MSENSPLLSATINTGTEDKESLNKGLCCYNTASTFIPPLFTIPPLSLGLVCLSLASISRLSVIFCRGLKVTLQFVHAWERAWKSKLSFNHSTPLLSTSLDSFFLFTTHAGHATPHPSPPAPRGGEDRAVVLNEASVDGDTLFTDQFHLS